MERKSYRFGRERGENNFIKCILRAGINGEFIFVNISDAKRCDSDWEERKNELAKENWTMKCDTKIGTSKGSILRRQ